jgi:hypothetical protein
LMARCGGARVPSRSRFSNQTLAKSTLWSWARTRARNSLIPQQTRSPHCEVRKARRISAQGWRATSRLANPRATRRLDTTQQGTQEAPLPPSRCLSCVDVRLVHCRNQAPAVGDRTSTAMSFDHASLDALRIHHPAWRLLRSDHAPLLASFLHRVFIAPNVRTMAAADLIEALEDELFALRERLTARSERHETTAQ